MKLFIKNMVCIRCKMVVKDVFTNMGLHYLFVELGEAEIMEQLTPEQQDQLQRALLRSGLELIDDRKSILIQKIKSVIIEQVHYSEDSLTQNFSLYLSEKLNYDYTYLANLFSETLGITIERFFITHKIEKVKELLVYDELTLTQIAYQMQYSSVAHLSAQFKKITGFTPSYFKKLKDKRRSALEDF